MSFRIRYDKSKIIRTRYETELKSEIFKLIKNFVGLNTKNPLYQRKTHISTGCRCCCSICCSGVSASSLSCCCLGLSMQWYHTGLGLVCTRVSHWVWCCTRASHWAVHHWIPLGAGSWCCQRHHSAIAVAPLQLGMDKPCANH